MPRKSPFKLLLTVDEKLRLQEIARKYKSPYCDVMRAKIVLLRDDLKKILAKVNDNLKLAA